MFTAQRNKTYGCRAVNSEEGLGDWYNESVKFKVVVAPSMSRGLRPTLKYEVKKYIQMSKVSPQGSCCRSRRGPLSNFCFCLRVRNGVWVT